MRRLSLVLLVSVTAVAAAKPPVARPLYVTAQVEAAGLIRYWEANLPLAKGDALSQAHLVDDVLYVVADSGTVFALTTAEGLIRWGEKVTERDYVVFRPTHVRQANGKGPLVIPTTTAVFVYDRFSGDLIQRFTPEFPISGPVEAIDNVVYMGSSDARFYSVFRTHPQACRPVKNWEVLAGGPVTASPVLLGPELLLFASQGGNVFFCRGEDKSLIWSYDVGGAVMGDLAVDDTAVYVPSTNRSLYKIDLATGKPAWRCRMPRPLYEGPVLAGQTVFQYCDANGISAIDPTTGNERWRMEQGRAFVSHTPGGDFMFTSRRSLQRVDHATGEVQLTLDLGDVITPVRNTRGATVYLAGKNGRVVCLQPADVPYLHRQQVNAARARLHLPPTAEPGNANVKKSAKKRKSQDKDPFRSSRDRSGG